MDQQTARDEQTGGESGGSRLAKLGILALTFVAGYVLGVRSASESDQWADAAREPTEITIDDGGDGTGDEEPGEE